MFVWSKLSAAQWADAWEERFSGAPHLSLVITEVPGRKTVRVEVFAEAQKTVLAIQKDWGGSVREVKKQNWAAMAPPPVEPLKVRDAMVISAARTPAEVKKAKAEHPHREVICVPVDLAFGTGHHATTETVLRWIVDFARERKGEPWTVCDLGTGTGILGIAADRLGARKVWGCDFDPQAVRVAKENVVRNEATHCTFVKADVLTWKPKQQWDLVLANIFYDILTDAFPTIVQALKPGGTVIVSGILKDQAPGCLAAGKRAGVKWVKTLIRGKWATAIGVR
jgi:ribosomal protein L11 methyltransferase